MSKIAVVSQLWDEEKKEWQEPELLHTFPHEDDDMAKAEASEEATMRLNELVQDCEKPEGERELGLPWLERIMVCPIVPGLGKGGSDRYAVEDGIFRLTVGLEP